MYTSNLRDFIGQAVEAGIKIILLLIIAELIVIAVGAIVITAKEMIIAIKKGRRSEQ